MPCIRPPVLKRKASNVFDAVAVVVDTGEERKVLVEASGTEIRIYARDTKAILEEYAYEQLVKWQPGEQKRSKSRPSKYLDITVETEAGQRDIRLKAKTSAELNAISDTLLRLTTAFASKAQEHKQTQPSAEDTTQTSAVPEPATEEMPLSTDATASSSNPRGSPPLPLGSGPAAVTTPTPASAPAPPPPPPPPPPPLGAPKVDSIKSGFPGPKAGGGGGGGGGVDLFSELQNRLKGKADTMESYEGSGAGGASQQPKPNSPTNAAASPPQQRPAKPPAPQQPSPAGGQPHSAPRVSNGSSGSPAGSFMESLKATLNKRFAAAGEAAAASSAEQRKSHPASSSPKQPPPPTPAVREPKKPFGAVINTTQAPQSPPPPRPVHADRGVDNQASGNAHTLGEKQGSIPPTDDRSPANPRAEDVPNSSNATSPSSDPAADLVSVSRQELSSMINVAISQALHGHHMSPTAALANYPHPFLHHQAQSLPQHPAPPPVYQAFLPSPYGPHPGYYPSYGPSPSWPYSHQQQTAQMAPSSPPSHTYNGTGTYEGSPPASPVDKVASSFSRVLEGAVNAAIHAGIEAATSPIQRSEYATGSPRLRVVDSALRRLGDSSLESGRSVTSVEQYQAIREEMEEQLVAKESEVLRIKDALGSREQFLSSADARIRSLRSGNQNLSTYGEYDSPRGYKPIFSESPSWKATMPREINDRWNR